MNTSILLDTHVWLWLLLEEKKLAPKTLSIIEEAIINSEIFISAITLWEVSMLAKKERIILEQPTLAWITQALKAPGTNLLPLTPEIAVESAELPGEFHGDPADRIIVATARIHELYLVTRDERILDYGKHKRVHTIPI